MKTCHERPGRRTIELEGRYLYQVTASTNDGQTATSIVAADNEGKARTALMLVQTTMHLRGQFVTYQVHRIATEVAP
jgi:hypothetical protein